MKKTQFFAKVICVALTLAVIISCATAFVACNKDATKTITDIFKTKTSVGELTSSRLEFTLPAGWTVYTSSVASGDPKSSASNINSDVGYIPSMDAFVVADSGKNLSIVKCGDSKVYFEGGMPGMILPNYIGINALRVKDGLIACKFSNGEAGVFDANGNTVLSRTKIGQGENAIASNVKIDVAIKILDGSLIAVNPLYDSQGETGYTSIYRPTSSGALSTRGALVARVANNDNKLTYVRGFDGKYVSVVGNSVGDCMYSIPAIGSTVKNYSGTDNGTVVNTGKSNYSSEITYIGGGRFFIHEDWTVNESDDYIYYDGNDYYVFKRRIYEPDKDKSSDYTKNEDKVFLLLSNNYYPDADKAGIDTTSYLNDGYTYAGYGLTIIGKVGFYDQFILDKNLNVVMSLTGNYGITLSGQKKDKVGFYDLIMQGVDGYFYNPYMPSEVNVYNSKGERVGHNNRHVNVQELTNNMMVAAITDPDDDNQTLYGAFNLYGEEVIKFEYYSLSTFRGAYTIGQKLNENRVKTMYVVGSDGNVVEQMSDGTKPLYDIATDSNGSAIYKIGCYMYKIDSGETDANGKTIYLYGVKNFNPNVDKNVIMPATMATGCVLYAPASSAKDVFVFEKITNGNEVTYSVYRLV